MFESNEVHFELVSQTDLSIVTVGGWTIKDLEKNHLHRLVKDKDQFPYLDDVPIATLSKS
jgi:hypothetical protein